MSSASMVTSAAAGALTSSVTVAANSQQATAADLISYVMSNASMVTSAAAGALTSSVTVAANSQQATAADLISKVQALATKAIACNADFCRIFNAFRGYWESANPGERLSYYSSREVTYYPYSAPIYYGGSGTEICNLLKKEDALVIKDEINQKLHAKAPALIAELDQLKQAFDKIAEEQRLFLRQPKNCTDFDGWYVSARDNLGFYGDVKGSFRIVEGHPIRVLSSHIVCLQEEVNFAIAGIRPFPPAPGPKDYYSLQPSRCTIM